MLAFVSPTGMITRYSLSIDFPPEQLKLAMVEAGEGNGRNGRSISSSFGAYSYDPRLEFVHTARLADHATLPDSVSVGMMLACFGSLLGRSQGCPSPRRKPTRRPWATRSLRSD